MPLYEYQCESCEHRFEKIQKFSDPLLDTCPSCGGTVRKLPSSPAIRFKGSGWYITDYAKNSPSDGSKESTSKDKGGSSTGSSESKKTDSKSDSKTDSKTDAKSDSKSDSKTDSKSTSAKS